MDNKWHDLVEGLEGIGRFVLYGLAWLVGLVGKFSMDVIKGKKFTWGEAVAEGGIALFVGVISGLVCSKWHVDDSTTYLTIAIATYLSGKIALIIWNWKDVKAYIINLLNKTP